MSNSICNQSRPNNCTTVCANTDVLGKGIRINFYCTMFLLALVPQTPHTEELLNALYANAGIAGLGLLLTAIIQTLQRQLSLFHAIFTLHILYFLGTGASPMGKYHWTRGRIAMGVFIQFVSVLAFTGWGLYLWVIVDTYGQQPECNDRIKYVILFFTVRATAPWLRGLWIAALVLSAVGLMIQFGTQTTLLLLLRRAGEEERAGETNTITRHSTRTGTQSQAEAEETEMDVLKPWYLSISYPLLLSSIYSTVMLELTVHRNEANILDNGSNVGPGVVEVDDRWAFGQVLAVVMVIANVNEMVHFLFGFQARRNQRRRLAHESQAQEEGTAHQAEGGSPAVEYRTRGVYGSSSSTCDASPDKIASEYELRNLENRKALLSAPTRGLVGTQSQDQPLR